MVVIAASSSLLFLFFFAIEILCEGQRTNRPLSDGLYTLSITSTSFQVSAMSRYDKFHYLFEDILAQIALDFSSEFEIRSLLKERAAFAVIFAIKHVCYSSRITIIIIVHRQVRNVDKEILFVIFGTPPSFWRKAYGNDYGSVNICFLRLIVSWQLQVNLGLSLVRSQTVKPKTGWKTACNGGTVRV